MAASSEAASKALRAGARAPLFALRDTHGQGVSLDRLLDAGPVILHFFRGAWCSFGERGLADLAGAYDQFKDLGASAMAIAPPSKPAAPVLPLPMPELIDENLKVSRAFGLAYELPLTLRARYEELGYQPPVTRTANSFLVPIPATYLIDHEGVVALAYVDVDYRNGFDVDSLVKALRALQARRLSVPRSPKPGTSSPR
ncbi:AhpC/TSA family protein [Dyella halodurans]|uniref:thioredoxin-dependent peroxiredoxin n=1 Tax=Dyella halodurans TaxID=1920171 RepID=A0ABV9C3H3_9GAMM|nr:peroxiredoxin-like family protein [Dyella halodurans]